MLTDLMQIWICRSRKLNSQLENAIQEAMLELDRMTEQQQSAAAGTASAAVSNEPMGRLRRSTHRWPSPSLSCFTASILVLHTILFLRQSIFWYVAIISYCSSISVLWYYLWIMIYNFENVTAYSSHSFCRMLHIISGGHDHSFPV